MIRIFGGKGRHESKVYMGTGTGMKALVRRKRFCERWGIDAGNWSDDLHDFPKARRTWVRYWRDIERKAT